MLLPEKLAAMDEKGLLLDVTAEMKHRGGASESNIRVELTDESEAHCLKIVFQARNALEPLEIFLHTTQAIDLNHKLSLAICELHHRDGAMLLEMMKRHVLAIAKASDDPNATR